MTATHTNHSTVHLNPAAGSMVLFQDAATRHLGLVPRRRRDALIARLLHARLDRRLAAGEASHRSRLLAVRAAELVTPRSRNRLAARWERIAIEARTAAARGSRFGAGPSRTGTEAVDLVDSVAAVLRDDRFVPAQGIARSASTLGTAATASFWLGAGGDDVLAAAARAALAAMNPPAYSASSAARPA